MILRIVAPVLSAGVLLLVVGCGDILSPSGRGPHGLWIAETGVVLKPGETLTLTARVQETGSTGRLPGSGIEPAANARWWTDDTEVIRLRSGTQGRVEALAPGRATVWVQVGARRDSASVTVLAEGEAPTHRWKAVATYNTGTCALDVQGHAYCWGDDFWGGWGTGGDRRQFTNAHRPVRVNTSRTFEEIGRGLGFACARTAGGEVWCWGLHHGAQLGHARTSIDYETGPVRVDFSGQASALSVGAQHACLLDSQNRAHCWGSNLGFQLGVAEDILSSAKRGGRTLPVAFDGTFDQIAVGSYMSCGITPARDLYCWGVTYGGSAAMGEKNPLPSRVDTPVLPRVVSPGGGGCFLSDAGEVYCWGLMRLEPTGVFQSPVAATIESRFDQIARPCALKADGTAWCWGSSFFDIIDAAQTTEPCGLPSTNLCSSTPIAVPGGHHFLALSVGEASCGITIEGELYCWGGNEWGQLGIGRPDVKSTHIPQRVVDPL